MTYREQYAKRQDEMMARIKKMQDELDEALERGNHVLDMAKKEHDLSRPEARIDYNDGEDE